MSRLLLFSAIVAKEDDGPPSHFLRVAAGPIETEPKEANEDNGEFAAFSACWKSVFVSILNGLT